MDGDLCEYCDGIVHERIVEREGFKHKNGFVILKNVPIGICNKCGGRYYSDKVLHEVDEIASGRRQAEEKVVPIAEYAWLSFVVCVKSGSGKNVNPIHNSSEQLRPIDKSILSGISCLSCQKNSQKFSCNL